MDKNKGVTFLETIIAFSIILIVINPIYGGLIQLKKSLNKTQIYNTIENDMEKARAFYQRNEIDEKMKTLNSKTKIELKKKQLEKNLFKIEILLENNGLKRESEIYVYG